jgi:hypothetical protein
MERFWTAGFLVAVAAWIAFSSDQIGEWGIDAEAAVTALSHGHVSDYLSAPAMMGPLGTAIQAPFVALASTPLSQYQWACIPCLLAAAALGLYLAEIARRRGAGLAGRLLVAVLPLLNPLTICAIQAGHPEEVLTAALAVGAVVVAARGHGLGAGLLLGLAIASKQWAAIAVLPALLVLPQGKLRCGAIALGLTAVLYLPGLIADPSAFNQVQSSAASAGGVASIWNIWYPFANVDAVHLGGGLTGYVHRMPSGIGPLTHPLIVLAAILLPIGVCLRRGRFQLRGEEALALLALLVVIRCVLDPNDNIYYHLPLIPALVAWDALSHDRLPLRGLAAAAVSLLFWRWSLNLGDLHLFNAVYLAVMLGAGLAIAGTLLRRQAPAPAAREAGAAPALG